MHGSDCHMCNIHTRYAYILCAVTNLHNFAHRFVGVDTLAQQWQRMGVEPPHNQSLEDALREVYKSICLWFICHFLCAYDCSLYLWMLQGGSVSRKWPLPWKLLYSVMTTPNLVRHKILHITLCIIQCLLAQ